VAVTSVVAVSVAAASGPQQDESQHPSEDVAACAGAMGRVDMSGFR
jgi:hypothetical protein